MARCLFSTRHLIIPKDDMIERLAWARSGLVTIIVATLAWRLHLIGSDGPEPSMRELLKPYFVIGATFLGIGLLMAFIIMVTPLVNIVELRSNSCVGLSNPCWH